MTSEQLEPPDDTCERCGRLYLVWPGYSFGLCGLHTIEIEIEVGPDECPDAPPWIVHEPDPCVQCGAYNCPGPLADDDNARSECEQRAGSMQP